MIYLLLYFEFFKVGLFTFGGGYASLPLIYDAVVQNNAWITAQQYADIIALEGMAPGPMGINVATFVGTLIAGLPGSIIATAGLCTPAMFICTIIARFYLIHKEENVVQSILSSLRPTAIGLIAAAATTIFLMGIFNNGDGKIIAENFNIWSVFIFGGGLYLLRKSRVSELWLIVMGLAIGIILYPIVS